MIITLEEAKTQLRVTHEDEDALILLYIGAAEERIVAYTGRPIPENSFRAKAAACLIVADLYENREEHVIGDSVNLNPAVDNLLYSLRNNLGV